MEALLLVLELGGPTMFARIGVTRAFNRHVERVFDPSCKDHHWAKRKLAGDASASSRVPIRARELPSFPDVQPIVIGSGLPFFGSAGGKSRLDATRVSETSDLVLMSETIACPIASPIRLCAKRER
jgi:hypothetical protein